MYEGRGNDGTEDKDEIENENETLGPWLGSFLEGMEWTYGGWSVYAGNGGDDFIFRESGMKGMEEKRASVKKGILFYSVLDFIEGLFVRKIQLNF